MVKNMANKKDVTGKSKDDKTMSEVSEQLSTDSAKYIEQIINEQKLSKNMQYQNEQHKQFYQDIECLTNAAREQQLSSEQQIQSTLNQASTCLADSKRLENLFNNAQQLQQAAQLGLQNLQMNAAQYKAIIEQMEKECYEQQVASDMQVVQSMQQAISSMAQAQNSLIQSQSINKIFDSITTCEGSLNQIEQLNNTTPQ
jgi:hypothetical protein